MAVISRSVIVPGILFLMMPSTVLPDSINLVYTESNLPVEFLDIHTEPSIVHVGDSFRINATVINNTPNTITFKGLCDSPLSAVFNNNVVIEHGLACEGFTIVELKSGEKTSVVGPSSGIVYHASNAGMTNARITFTYAIQDESTSISKPFAFTINEGTQNLITAKLNSEFQLKIDQTVLIESKNISVRFLNVTEDSRCPSDVVCVWEGQVTILLNIMHKDQELGDLALTIRGGQTLAKSFDGYSIELMQVEPYPKASEPIQTSDYVATLLVSELETQNISVAMKFTKKIVLLAVRNAGDFEIYGLQIKADDGNVKFVKARGWDARQIDQNPVIIGTDDRPLTKGRTMIVLLLLDNRDTGLEWTALGANNLIISSGALSPRKLN